MRGEQYTDEELAMLTPAEREGLLGAAKSMDGAISAWSRRYGNPFRDASDVAVSEDFCAVSVRGRNL